MPGAFEQHALLWIGQLCLTRGEAEEAVVEAIRARHHARAANVVGVLEASLRHASSE